MRGRCSAGNALVSTLTFVPLAGKQKLLRLLKTLRLEASGKASRFIADGES